MSDQNPYSTPDASLASETIDTYNPKFFSPRGRIGRLRYLAYNMIAGSILMAIAIPIIGTSTFTMDFLEMSEVSLAVFVLVNILSVVISAMYSKRRLNDLNRSGWFCLLLIIPIINFILVIYLVLFSGTDGVNDYGPKAIPTPLGIKIIALFIPVITLIGVAAATVLPVLQ